MLRHMFAVGTFAIVASAQAQEITPRVQLEAAFDVMLSGDLAAAKGAFDAVAKSAPKDSVEQWLASQLSAFALSTSTAELPQQPFDSAPLKVALGLCVEGKGLDCQIAFLSAASLSQPGSANREFSKKLAKLAEAQENGRTAPAAALTVENNPSGEPSQEENNAAGMFSLIFTGAALGVGGGILADINFEIGDAAALTVPLLTGVAGGVGGYAYAKVRHKGEYSFERAGAVAVGTMLGTVEGLLISTLNDAALFGRGFGGDMTFIGALVGAGAGLVVSEVRPGDRGDAFLVFSSATWATAFALEGFGLVAPDNADNLAGTITTGFNLGIAAGVAGAITRPISYRRLRIINGSGVLGTGAGALIGGIITIAGDLQDKAVARTIAGGSMAGSIGGLTAGYLLTQKLAPPKDGVVENEPGFQTFTFGNAQGITLQDRPLTINAMFSF